jgi:hypothetical protein
MALQLPASAARHSRHESATHWLAHRAVIFVRPVFLFFLVATFVFMATFPPFAVATGLVAVATGMIVLLGRGVEDHTQAGDEATASAEAREAEESAHEAPAELASDALQIPGGEIDSRILMRESRRVVGIVVGLVSVALLLGFTLFEWPMLGLGVGVVAIYGAIVTFPAWAAWIEGDAEEEAERLAE